MQRQETSPTYVAASWAGWVNVAAVFTALILLSATVWAAGNALNEKANQTDVRMIREQQSTVKKDIAVIKNDIAQIKLWLQPPTLPTRSRE